MGNGRKTINELFSTLLCAGRHVGYRSYGASPPKTNHQSNKIFWKKKYESWLFDDTFVRTLGLYTPTKCFILDD